MERFNIASRTTSTTLLATSEPFMHTNDMKRDNYPTGNMRPIIAKKIKTTHETTTTAPAATQRDGLPTTTIPSRASTPSPGILCLLRNLPSICLPFIALFLVLRLGPALLSLSLPFSLSPALPFSSHLASVCASRLVGAYSNLSRLSSAAILLLLLPVLYVLRIAYTQCLHRRRAAALGAQALPRIQGKWWVPGNLDLLVNISKALSSGYIAEPLWPFIRQAGNVYNLPVFGKDMIFTIEPEHVRQVLATEYANFEKGELFRSYARSVLGDGVFNSDGPMWRFHRNMTRPFFVRDDKNTELDSSLSPSNSHISAGTSVKSTHHRRYTFELFERHTGAALEHAVARSRRRAQHANTPITGDAIDVQDWFGRFTLDTASDLFLGKCVGAMKAGLPRARAAAAAAGSSLQDEDHEDEDEVDDIDDCPFATPTATSAAVFAQAFQDAQAVIYERAKMKQIWPLKEMLSDRSERPMRVVSAFMDPIVEEAVRRERARRERVRREEGKKTAGLREDEKKEHGHEEEHEGDDETLLDHLVKQTDDPAIVKDELLNIILAGRDTTTATLTFSTYVLAMHPHVLAKLRAEVLDVVGRSRVPTQKDIRSMRYLRAFLNEVLRLYPPVPFDIRQSINETTFVNKSGGKAYYVPPRTLITYSVFMMHRRTDLWGLDAHEFDPERFLDERLRKYLTPNPFIFLPFNAGPRICLGQQFALTEASFMLIRLLQSFDRIELATDVQPVETLAPEAWKTEGLGRQRAEKLRFKSHLTLHFPAGMWVRFHEPSEEGTNINIKVE